MSFEKKIAAARNRNCWRDAADRRFGFATPSEIGVGELIATARSAIESAIKTGNQDFAAEAYVFLTDALSAIRKGS